jgi:hypothetical protein
LSLLLLFFRHFYRNENPGGFLFILSPHCGKKKRARAGKKKNFLYITPRTVFLLSCLRQDDIVQRSSCLLPRIAFFAFGAPAPNSKKPILGQTRGIAQCCLVGLVSFFTFIFQPPPTPANLGGGFKNPRANKIVTTARRLCFSGWLNYHFAIRQKHVSSQIAPIFLPAGTPGTAPRVNLVQ